MMMMSMIPVNVLLYYIRSLKRSDESCLKFDSLLETVSVFFLSRHKPCILSDVYYIQIFSLHYHFYMKKNTIIFNTVFLNCLHKKTGTYDTMTTTCNSWANSTNSAEL